MHTSSNLSISAAGFVLAGGQSSRMGADKSLASFAGQPLVANALSILKAAGLPVAIAGARSGHSRSELARLAQVIPDQSPPVGPLGGVQAAFAATSAEWSLFLPVDLPLTPPSLLACLLGTRPAQRRCGHRGRTQWPPAAFPGRSPS